MLQDFQRDFPKSKTTDYFFALSLKEKLKAANAFDVLYQKDGLITESSRSNFFLIDHDNNIITSETGVLMGITRQKLIEAVKGRFNVVERPLFTSELANAKEAFMTSSVKRVIPVTEIDDLKIGDGKPGDVTKLLMKLMENKDRGYINNFRHI